MLPARATGFLLCCTVQAAQHMDFSHIISAFRYQPRACRSVHETDRFFFQLGTLPNTKDSYCSLNLPLRRPELRCYMKIRNVA